MFIYLNIKDELKKLIYSQIAPSSVIDITSENFINLNILEFESSVIVIYKFQEGIETNLYILKEKLNKVIFIGLFDFENLDSVERLLNNDLLNYCINICPNYEKRLLKILKSLCKEKNFNSDKLSDVEKSMITSFYIYDLIYGDLSRLDDIKNMKTQIGLKDKPNCAITIIIDDFWEICRSFDNKKRYEIKMDYLKATKDALYKLKIDGIACSLIGTDKLVILANFEKSRKDMIIKICKDIRNYIISKTKYSVTIGIGSIVDNYKILWKSYDEAFKALDYSFYLGAGNVIHYEETKDYTTYESSNEEIPNFKYLFFKNINQWDNEELMRQYKKIISYLINKSFNSETIKSIIIKFNFEITDYVLSLDSKNQKIYEYSIKLNSKVLRANFFEDIEKQFSMYMEEVSSIIEDLKEKDKIVFGLMSAKSFIDKYYYKEISLSDVADISNMSKSYFSRRFKKLYGKNYTDYLQEVRLSAAEDLLRNSDESIFEISEKVGFNDSFYFSKRFKEKYGQAPYLYRNLLRKVNN
ncbi:helix-turn-helix domain-containing protein [Peptoniphilus catoniae]|uniref:helix-turn-helix domain-containing protein n=1 Tax=Peptoniphilus catoniae TaxID=1660341 RepID=UPI0010FCEE96|nr:helix-turn-helix domain-containing protein [Peptoniphilus catoniae]